MLAVVMFGYGSLLLAGTLVTSYSTLLLQRFVLGLFLGGSFPVVVGIYVELFRPTLRGKLASAINATFSLAIITLGLTFGHFGSRDWRAHPLDGWAASHVVGRISLCDRPPQ